MVKVSRVIETKAEEVPQPDFLNAVAALETDLRPDALLGALLGIESAMGRVRLEVKGPRTIDLDLLLHGEFIGGGTFLTLPHPRMLQRAFVMGPLAEIAPNVEIPGTGKKVRDFLAKRR